MAERITGIQVHEEVVAGESIARAPVAVTAFVGRALRGPVNRPVTLHSFADYQRIFGGLWQPSTLSYAVEQFFDSGGTTAIVLRVANDARPCTLDLPAGTHRLRVQALQPGTREYLRAAVDYDGIGENETDRFNLVVQRVRTPGSEHIEDQEIYRRLSVDPASSRHVAAALAASQLVRVAGPVPPVRPDVVTAPGRAGLAGYILSNADGDDGGPLSDYDIIGSAAEATGLFALGGAESFNLLCIPPPSRDVDLGPSALLVAHRYCRDRRALLVVDPPSAWQSAADALAAMREWPLASDSAFMYFPRLLAYDKLRGRFESFAPCGAVAGMLSRAAGQSPLWSAAMDEGLLRPGLRPLCAVTDAERQRLAAAGVNVLQALRPPAANVPPACTLAGAGAAPEQRLLGARRLTLMILGSVERGTRWMLFEPSGLSLWRKAEAQLSSFFASLDEERAFDGAPAEGRWFVVCDERINRAGERDRGVVNVLFGFAIGRAGRVHAYLLTHRAGGSRIKPVTLNRLHGGHVRGEILIEDEELPPLVVEGRG
ncbi:MAG: hypothetical protein MUC71_09015 [Steroidobacteraceae bacterium]|nr:hypothetical protein [Steroidobacteraceae bacterium]